MIIVLVIILEILLLLLIIIIINTMITLIIVVVNNDSDNDASNDTGAPPRLGGAALRASAGQLAACLEDTESFAIQAGLLLLALCVNTVSNTLIAFISTINSLRGDYLQIHLLILLLPLSTLSIIIFITIIH